MAEHVFVPFADRAKDYGGADYGLKTLRTGRETEGTHGYSRVFVSRYPGHCERCDRSIEIGDDIRYHNDYSKPVHANCCDYTHRAESTKPTVKGQRKNTVCSLCFLEHAGECL